MVEGIHNPGGVKIGSWLIEGEHGRKAQVSALVEIAGSWYACYRFEGRKRLNKIRLDRINNGRRNSWRVAPETA